MDRNVEIADQGAQDGNLSGILLSEVGYIRRDDVEQLGDNRCNSAKVTGTRNSVETVADSLHFYDGGRGGWVHLLLRGDEEQVDAFGCEQGAVGFEEARVFVEILARAELKRVHKDGRRD